MAFRHIWNLVFLSFINGNVRGSAIASTRLPEQCLWITKLSADTNGIYTLQDSGVWGNKDGSSVLAFIKDGGWSGCMAVNHVPDSNCLQSRRWAFISDLSIPVVSNVNIWTKQGDSTGITTDCTTTTTTTTTATTTPTSVDSGFDLQFNNTVKDVDVLYKTWSISFDVMPTKVVEGTFNIIRVGDGGHSRLPAIYFKNESTALEVRTEIDGEAYKMKTEEIAVNSWTHIELSQEETTSNVFEFIIRINNKEVHRKRNNNPTVNDDIKVYASAGDYSYIPAAHAKIRNIIHQSPLLSTLVTYEIGATGCHGACRNEPDYFKNGRCTHCDGYCCRADGRDNYCSDDILNAVTLPDKPHFCVAEIISADVVPDAEVATICEHTEHAREQYADGNLVCPTGSHIQVSEAIYGRSNDGNQSCAPDTAYNKTCESSHDVTKEAKAACDNKNACSFVGKNSMYGDPCDGVYKYTLLTFSCREPNL